MRSNLHYEACSWPNEKCKHVVGCHWYVNAGSSLCITSCLSELKSFFSLSLTFNSRLAPDPSLVIYAIFPSGGVIADKIQFSVEMCFDNQVK